MPQPGSGRSSFDSLTLFTFFWGVGVLTHQAFHDQFTLTSWHDLLLIAAAWAAVLRPSSIARLAVLAVAQVVEVGIEMPLVYNHWLLVGLGNLTILSVLALRPGRRPDGAWDRARLYDALAPPLRLVLIGAYAFAFLAKVNRAFLDPQLSCAGVIYARLARRVSMLPTGEWTRIPAIWFTVAIEALIPALLALRRTRVLGVLVAYAFHVLMGLAGFYDFSAAAAGFLVLFLPEDTPDRLVAFTERHRRLAAVASGCRRAARSAVALPVVLAASYGLMAQIDAVESPFAFTMRVWFAGAVVCLTLLAIEVWRGLPVSSNATHLRVAHPLFLLGPVLIVLNGLSPYVGLKTEHSFTMFSNLVTEGDSPNHLIVPASLRLFGMQDDVVRIVDSSHPRIRRYAERRRPLVYYSFQRLVGAYPSASVTYERNGRRYDVPRVGDDPEFSRSTHPLIAKTFNFRVVRPTCGH